MSKDSVSGGVAGSVRPSAPFHMVWISTNACNARCLHCSSASDYRAPDELSTREVADLFDSFVEMGVFDVAVSGGEPLLRRDLFDLLAHGVGQGLVMGVGSNGGKLTARQALALLDVGVARFQVSLDGLEVSHDQLRRWPGLYHRVHRSIAIAQAAGLRVHVCCTINRLNVRDLETFTEHVASLGVARLNFSRYVPTGRGTDALDLESREWKLVMQRCAALKRQYRATLDIVGHLAQQIIVDEDVRDMPAFIGCQAGIGQGCVSARGRVYPCVLLPVDAGNVRERPFAEIWAQSPVLAALRDRARLTGACSVCSLQARCGGCRAVAFAKSGDYLASDPRCWLPADAASPAGRHSGVGLPSRHLHILEA